METPDVDDFLACSDLCEENRFLRQARLLRALAGAGGKVYLVAERGIGYNDECYYVDREDDGEPRSAFADRDEAERAAALRNARMLRDVSLTSYGNDTPDLTSLPLAELERRAGVILGVDFRIWDDEGVPYESPISPIATDEQMLKLAELFDRLRFFHVVEAEFGG